MIQVSHSRNNFNLKKETLTACLTATTLRTTGHCKPSMNEIREAKRGRQCVALTLLPNFVGEHDLFTRHWDDTKKSATSVQSVVKDACFQDV